MGFYPMPLNKNKKNVNIFFSINWFLFLFTTLFILKHTNSLSPLTFKTQHWLIWATVNFCFHAPALSHDMTVIISKLLRYEPFALWGKKLEPTSDSFFLVNIFISTNSWTNEIWISFRSDYSSYMIVYHITNNYTSILKTLNVCLVLNLYMFSAIFRPK